MSSCQLMFLGVRSSLESGYGISGGEGVDGGVKCKLPSHV